MESSLFQEKPLEELVDVYDSLRKPVTASDRKPGPYPYYGASGITDYVDSFIFDGEYLLLSEDGDNLRTQNTPIAFMATGKFWVNNHAHILKANLNNCTKYVCYALQIADVTSYISGSTRPKLNQKDMRRILVCSPPLPEQRAIAHILSSLDYKIELNRRMNETLEGMAQALFKSWFVDFDPVIDNAIVAGNPIPEELADRAEVRRAALANGTANREAAKPFPAAFQQTEELGWIPNGWEVRKMREHCEIIMGHSPKGDTYNTDGVGTPLVNGPVEFGPYFTQRTKWTTAPTRMSVKGDLVVCVRGSTTGRFVKSDGEYCLGRGVCSIRGIHSQCFVDQLFRSNLTALLGLTTGSTFPNWSRPSLTEFKTVSPPVSIVRAFDEYVAPCVIRIESGVVEAESLTKLRDTLLPKLISGELRIPDAEKLAEAALA